MAVKLFMKLTVVTLIGLIAMEWVNSYAEAGQQKPKRKTKVETRFDKKRNETHAHIGPFEIWKHPALIS